MKKANAKRFASAVLIGLLVNSQVAGATGLQDMWNSNVTAGGNIDTKNRHGFFGGSAVIRTPIQSVQMFNFSPPKVSAGCAGADIYMGSFSYINKDQIVSTLKAIMNNAQGLLFQAAIEFVSPMISGLMTKFNDLAQKLNSMQMNSCQIATSMMGPVTKAAGSYGESAATWLASTGSVGDWLTTKTDSASVTKAQLAQKEAQDASSGNIVWKAIVNSQADQKIQASMFPVPAAPADVQFKRELLMSFLGTVITTVANSSKTDGTAINDVASIERDSQIDFLDLLKGGQGKKKFVCDPADLAECKTNVTKADLNFIDAQTYIQVMMFGDPAWLATGNSKTANDNMTNLANMTATVHGHALHAHPSSVVAVIAGATAANKNLTADQTKFLDVMGDRVVKLISDLHAQELSSIKYLSGLLEEEMELKVALQFSDAFFMSVNEFAIAKRVDGSGNPIAGDTTISELPQQVRERLNVLGTERIQLMERLAATDKNFAEARKFVDEIIKSRARTRDNY